jgi:hypothetical protein
MGAVMKGIVIAAEFAAVNRAKIIKTNEGCCCFAMPRINFDSRHPMKVQNVQAVQPLRSVQIVQPGYEAWRQEAEQSLIKIRNPKL